MSGIIFSDNWDRVIHSLQNTEALVMDEIEPAMNDAVELVRVAESEYPPQVNVKTHYQRTGNLGRSWSGDTSRDASEIKGTVQTDSGMAPYAPYVMGAESQINIFVGNWTKGVEVFRGKYDDITRVLGDAARRAFAKFK
jgi:hypothetical protein